MRKVVRLKRAAWQVAARRGHILGRWTTIIPNAWVWSMCERRSCGAQVEVDLRGAISGPEIKGSGVEHSCPWEGGG